MIYQTVSDIRQVFTEKYKRGEIVTNDTGSLSGADTIEILGASFIADEPAFFGSPNNAYVQHELDWYKSCSLNVNDIPGGVPAIWKSVATPEGFINSNYGWMIYSLENGNQFGNVLAKLLDKPSSRQGTMIYNRPSMHADWCEDGKKDFCCTNAVTYLIRDNKLNAIVQMRSNDLHMGYRNDYAWAKYVLDDLTYQYNLNTSNDKIESGVIYWQVASLHIYSRQFYLIEDYIKNNITRII